MLRRKIADEFLPRAPAARLAVNFESFGFKHGPRRATPTSSSTCASCPTRTTSRSCARSPGTTRASCAYIARDGTLEQFYERLDALLDFLLPRYVAEGKSHLTVAIGCTGGRHRSVAIAEHLAARYRRRDDVIVQVAHRDVDHATGKG